MPIMRYSPKRIGAISPDGNAYQYSYDFAEEIDASLAGSTHILDIERAKVHIVTAPAAAPAATLSFSKTPLDGQVSVNTVIVAANAANIEWPSGSWVGMAPSFGTYGALVTFILTNTTTWKIYGGEI